MQLVPLCLIGKAHEKQDAIGDGRGIRGGHKLRTVLDAARAQSVPESMELLEPVYGRRPIERQGRRQGVVRPGSGVRKQRLAVFG